MRIGVDLGGTKIEGVVLGEHGTILKRLRLPTPQMDYSATLNTITTLVSQLEQEYCQPNEKLPVGLATPGSISLLNGRMKNCNSTCLNGENLKQDLERLLQRDLRIANDADCFALSEAQDGAAADYHSVFGVILGTGVGGGIVVDKQLLCGPNGIAGEWGHNPMPPLMLPEQASWDTRSCYCGRENCIEAYLSGPAFAKTYAVQAGHNLTVQEIMVKVGEGDAQAMALLNLYIESLAAALATMINVLDPAAVVLGGGLSNIEQLYQQIPQRWGKYIFTDQCGTPLLRAKHGDSSGVRGAAWLWP